MRLDNDFRLAEDIDAFVHFGQVLTRRMRMYIADYLIKKIGIRTYWKPSEELLDSYQVHLSAQLDFLFENEQVLAELLSNQLLARRILSEVLFFFRNVAKKTQKQHPWQVEQATLEGWTARPISNLLKQWPFLLRDMLATGEVNEPQIAYHRTKLKELEKSFDITAFDLVINDLLAIWDASLQTRILRWQLSQIEDDYQQLKENIENKTLEIIRVKSTLGQITDFLNPDWNLNSALIRDEDFNVLEQFNTYLKDHSSIQHLADMLGSLREAEMETVEEYYERQLTTYSLVRNPNYKSEITGITLGDSLPHVLPQDLSLLGESETEWKFLKKFADHQLLQWQYDDSLRIKGTEEVLESRTLTRKKKKGPFIVCVDTSGSMEGIPEKIAKVLCFAIIRMAASHQRPAYLINFSTGIKTIDLYNVSNELGALVEFLKMSFRGGTDISLALDEALRQLETHQYKNADVLVISDFIMYRISEDIMQRVARQQLHYGTAFHSLIISNEANERVVERFDHVWLYNPDDKNIIQRIYKSTQQFGH
ncbi:MAG: VWA domain-containing protein [Thermaurantimonas sp.]|uniref:VWA domain-containing protein n=1 Tax=Thermaurantimonas sp. TaxID=2681568 RepID=UPI00391CECE4